MKYACKYSFQATMTLRPTQGSDHYGTQQGQI